MNEDQNEEVRQDVGIDQRFEDTKTPAHDDKRGDRTIFYVAHVDGVPNGYAENNRTKEVVRWKARGRLLSQESRAQLPIA